MLNIRSGDHVVLAWTSKKMNKDHIVFILNFYIMVLRFGSIVEMLIVMYLSQELWIGFKCLLKNKIYKKVIHGEHGLWKARNLNKDRLVD